MTGAAAVLIAGATTSGKSALAIRLAERLGGTIVNADSMQVYRDLAVITARPDAADLARAPHRLFGHVDGAVNHSVGLYLADLATVLAETAAEGRLPILVGGTGLYFKAALDGLSAMPPVPDEVRDSVRRATADLITPEIHARLVERDPAAAASLRPSDRLRVLRALEVVTATGRSILSFHGAREPGPLTGRPVVRIRLAVDRAALRDRIDRRFEAMMEAGAVGEVEALAARGLDPALPVMRAHGVPGLLAWLRGEASREEAVRRGQADTRAYAKRQETWARHQMADWTWCAPEKAETAVVAALGR